MTVSLHNQEEKSFDWRGYGCSWFGHVKCYSMSCTCVQSNSIYLETASSICHVSLISTISGVSMILAICMTGTNWIELINWMRSLRFPRVKKTNYLIEKKRWTWIRLWLCSWLSAGHILMLKIIYIKLMTIAGSMLYIDCIITWQCLWDLM
jgi:hypothetical protein